MNRPSGIAAALVTAAVTLPAARQDVALKDLMPRAGLFGPFCARAAK